MFSKLDWYFSKKFLLASIFTGLIFYSLFFLVKILEFSGNQLSFIAMLKLASLGTVETFVSFISVIILMGYLFSFGSMAQNREIVAMQALGYTYFKMLSMVSKGILLVLTFWLVLVEFIFPIVITQSKHLYSLYKVDSNITYSTNGQWLHTGNHFVKVISSNDKALLGVNVYELDKQNRLIADYQAQKANWQKNRLLLSNVKIKQYDYQGEKGVSAIENLTVKSETTTTKMLKLQIDDNIFSYIVKEPKQMFIWQLLNYANYIQENNLSGGSEGKFIFAFWERVFMPLAVIGLILIFLPTMLGTPRVQRISDRIFYGVLVGTLYYIITEIARNSSDYINLPIIVSASFFPFALLIIGLLFSYRFR